MVLPLFADGIPRWYCKGISEDTFGVGMSVSRQDAAALISRAMKLTDKYNADAELFTDEADISDYALKSVKILRQMGIISGYEDGSFRPLGTITRAEAAKMLYEAGRMKPNMFRFHRRQIQALQKKRQMILHLSL